MNDNKLAFLSGRLNGIRTLETDLNSIENPDIYERFLKEYINLKLDIETNNEVIYLDDEQKLIEKLPLIEKSEYVSFSVDETFKKIYITTDDKITFVIKLNRANTTRISDLISKEKPVKFLLNSFPFIKWCNKKKIEMKNVYDIQTYIKLLTNEVDLGKTMNEYIKQYTKHELTEKNSEVNNVIIGNFIYEFGRYLENYIKEFELLSMCRLINENFYYEGLKSKGEEDCEIIFSYYELYNIINELVETSINRYKEKTYVLSPLGRIAIKFGRDEKEVITEIYLEDLEMLILNELYNNNIKVQLLDDNLYKVTCKFKKFKNVISLITAIMTDIFYRLFNEKVKIKLDCILKE